ncbi:unnamed protein product, partial [Rotaria sp. Silwood1]
RYWLNDLSSMLITSSIRRFSMSSLLRDDPVYGLPDDLCPDNSLQRQYQWKKHRSMANIEGKTILPFYTFPCKKNKAKIQQTHDFNRFLELLIDENLEILVFLD